MSILLKFNEKIFLFSKGAEEIMKEKSKQSFDNVNENIK